MKESEDKFSIFIPIEIQKSEDPKEDKYKNMMVHGIASTTKLGADSEGELLEPSGMDLRPLLTSGNINFHHLWSKDPLAIIGEPIKAEIRDNDLYIQGRLYSNSQKARDVYDLAEILQKDSNTRRIGWSIEGKALLRDKKNPKRILKSVINAVALTPSPRCPGTRADIMKGSVSDWDFEPNGGEIEPLYLVDVTGTDGIRRTVSTDFNIKVWPLEKSIDTIAIAPATPESVEHDKKKVRVKQDSWPAHNMDNHLIKNLEKANLLVSFLEQGYSKEDSKQLLILSEAIADGKL